MQYNISDSQALFWCYVLIILRMVSLGTLLWCSVVQQAWLSSYSVFFVCQNESFWSYKKIVYLSKHSHRHSGFILLIARYLSYYLHFAFCSFVWLIKLKMCPSSISPFGLLQNVILRGWKRGPWCLELLGEDLIWKGTSDLSSYPAFICFNLSQ